MKNETTVTMRPDFPSSDHPECPTCREHNTRRSRRSNCFERILSVAYVYPFRCHSCGKRFFRLQWGVQYSNVVHPSLYRNHGEWRLQYFVDLSSREATLTSVTSIAADERRDEAEERLVA